MRIVSVKLQNIRSYAAAALTFPEGSTLLWGDIGAGKTTILLAAEFALFGIIKGELAPENLLRHGALQGSVALTFAIEGKEHTIVRKLKRGKNGIGQDAGYLISDGEKYEGTAIELKAKILDLLGYPQDLLTKSKSLIYRYTVFTPQEQMKRILTDQAEHRLDTLRKVFGMDRYQRVAGNAEIAIRMLREREAMLAALTAPLQEKQKQLEEQQRSLLAAVAELDTIDPEVTRAEHGRNAAEGSLREAEGRLRKLLQLQQELAALEAELREKTATRTRNASEREQLAQHTQKLQEQQRTLVIQVIPERMAEVQQRITRTEQQLQAALAAHAAQQAELQALQREEQELVRRIGARKIHIDQGAALRQEHDACERRSQQRKAREAELQQVEQALAALAAELQTHHVHAGAARQLAQRIGALRDCPTCLQPVRAEHQHRIQQKQGELAAASEGQIQKLAAQHAVQEQQRSLLQRQLEDIRNAERSLSRVQAQLTALAQYEREQGQEQQRLSNARAALSRITALQEADGDQQRKSLQQAIAADRELLTRIQHQEALLAQRKLLDQQLAEQQQRRKALESADEALEQSIGKLRNQFNERQGQRSALAGSEQQHIAAKQHLADAVEQYRTLSVQQATLRAQRDALQQAVQQLTEECAAGAVAAQEHTRLGQLEHWLSEAFLNVLAVMEKQVMVRVHQEFSQLFQQWFGVLMEDELLAARLDDTFNPVIEQNGYETDIESLSGGERTALALAYRLALNKVINTLISTIKTRDLIVLDEPTDGFSDQQLDRVREVLGQLNMRQVILVSHESKIESFVDHVIRIGKEGHESKVM